MTPRSLHAAWLPLLAVLGLLVGLGTHGAVAQEPPTTTWTVDGLDAPAEILVDRWGVPHLYAASQDDVFFLQGFNAARDRLWQLDLWKRRGDGTLSEAFGPGYVEQDRAARLLLYRGDLYREWLAYASDTKRIVTAFVAGINAFVELTERHPELLPLEFELLDYRPARWTPETVVRIRSHGLLRNLRSEVERALFLRRHGAAALALRDRYEPEHELVIPDGLDLDAIPEGVLDVYRLGTSWVSFEPQDAGADEEAAPRAAARRRAARLLDAFAGTGDRRDLGSNNWAVAPSRTATGRPILADDPHRIQALPSLRYIAHLSAPGLDVIGAGEPALPGVSIGHNGTIAFGLTIFAIDQEDLYVYDTDPENPRHYRYRDRFEPVETVRETIPVRGAPDVEVELELTRHGPVLFRDDESRRLFALRAAWLEPGMAPYLGSIEYMRARNWDEFLAAMNRWGAPSENQVYADVEGNIGWKPGGLAPIRPNWDGLLPVPGDGRYEWAGFLDMDQLPVEANPERGFVASANQMNLPPGYPHPLGYEWTAPYRYARIVEVLGSQPRHSLDDSLRLQADYLSIPARRLVALLDGLRGESRELRRALALLRGWDARLDADSPAAALFEVWWRRHLPPAAVEALARVDDRVEAEAVEALATGIDREGLLQLLERPAPRLGADAEATRVRVLLDSLAAAWQETVELLGPDPGRWQWGTLHTIELHHPLAERLPPELRDRGSVGPLPRGGSGETVGNTAYSPQTFEQVSGASFRMVIDVGNWDASLAINSPGQSGDPRSPHWADLFPLWARDEAVPLLYSRERVLEATARRIELLPRGAP